MMRMNGMVLVCTIAAAGACAEVVDESDLPEEVTWRDHVYDRVDRVGDDGIARLPGTAGQGRELRDVPAALAARPRAELAESLRMTILHPNGGAYVARTPNWEAADATLHPSGPIDRISRAFANRPGAADRAAAARDAAAVVRPDSPAGQADLVIGSDGRTLSPTTLAPFDAIARVEVYTSASGGSRRIVCTGSYIGPWTFVLAGHCLRFTDGAFAKRIVFEPARAGASLPFGRFDCRNGDASPSNDFLAAVPAAYGGATGEDPLDFAVIDTYPCHAAPRWFAGYSVDTGSTTYSMHGYPIGLCPGAPAEGMHMCGMSGPAYLNEWRIETEHIDGTDGQDGAPWWTTNPTRVAGVHIGYREYGDFWRCGFEPCRRNYARRIDGAMDTFIRAIAYDF
jgi:V8-like Glu-specific endopeptidase